MTTLLLGATGTLGRTILRLWGESKEDSPGDVVGLSRDEYKVILGSWASQAPFSYTHVLGDIRDPNRVSIAMQGVDTVIHAAAMKQVGHSGPNVQELASVNVEGTANVLRCAQQAGVSRFIFVSSDKAVAPQNAYGMTKALGEQLVLAANTGSLDPWHYNGMQTRLGMATAVVRYGNVIRSRGSVMERWERTGDIRITDATRFWWTRDDAAAFLLRSLASMHGGETFIPQMKAAHMSVAAGAYGVMLQGQSIAGAVSLPLGPGEKQHEVLSLGHPDSGAGEQFTVDELRALIESDQERWPA